MTKTYVILKFCSDYMPNQKAEYCTYRTRLFPRGE